MKMWPQNPDQPDSRISCMKNAFSFELNFKNMTYEDVTPMHNVFSGTNQTNQINQTNHFFSRSSRLLSEPDQPDERDKPNQPDNENNDIWRCDPNPFKDL